MAASDFSSAFQNELYPKTVELYEIYYDIALLEASKAKKYIIRY